MVLRISDIDCLAKCHKEAPLVRRDQTRRGEINEDMVCHLYELGQSLEEIVRQTVKLPSEITSGSLDHFPLDGSPSHKKIKDRIDAQYQRAVDKVVEILQRRGY